MTDGEYLGIRVRMNAGGYAYGSSGRGGPGFWTIEPCGDGTLTDAEVNWANKPNFSTVATVFHMTQDGATRFNDGSVQELARTGCTLVPTCISPNHDV